jgi:CHAT domain-containing protein
MPPGTKNWSPHRVAGFIVLAMAGSASNVLLGLVPAHAEESIELREAQFLTAEQTAADHVTYRFDATANRTYLVEVTQQGLDLIIDIQGPSESAGSYNSPLGRDESEFVLLENLAAVTYRVTLRSTEHTGAQGAHRIQIVALPDEYGAELAAWKLMSSAAFHNAAGSQDSWQQAARDYRHAADAWHQLGQQDRQAQALYSAAAIEYWRLYRWDRAEELAATAASIYENERKPDLRANALQLQGAAILESASSGARSLDGELPPETRQRFAEAIRRFELARDTHERPGHAYDHAYAINRIGLSHFYMGELPEARDHWERAATLFHNSQEWGAELEVRQNLAVTDLEQGRLRAAIDVMEQALALLPASGMEVMRAYFLDNRATALRHLGRLDEALQTSTQALAIHRRIDDGHGEAFSLLGLGQSYFVIGDLELASAHLDQALARAIKANAGQTSEAARAYLGNIAYLQSDFERARELHEAALVTARSALDRARLRLFLARDLRALRRLAEADLVVESVLTGADAAKADLLRADALHEQGRIALAREEPESAAEKFTRALRIYEAFRLTGRQADALNGLSLAARDRGQVIDAVELGEESLRHIEGLRTEVAEPELRAFYAAARRGYYDAQISLLMDLWISSEPANERYLRTAFGVSERARARMTAELLTEAAVDLRKGLGEVATSRRHELIEQLAELRYQRDQTLAVAELAGKADDRLAALVSEMAAIEHELNLIDTEMRRAQPVAAEIHSPTLLDAQSAQAQLDNDTVLLQYALAPERSYAWIVSRDAITGVELADGATIEATARAAFEDLRLPQSSPVNRARRDDQLARLSALVWEPVAAHVKRGRVLIAADGALQYIPFGILARDADSAEPLISADAIVTIPSMSVLAAQRSRLPAAPATRTVVVIADPVFDADPRLSDLPGEPVTLAQNVQELAGNTDKTRLDELRRLPYTGREADGISGLVPDDARTVLIGFDANREAVLGLDLSQYRYVHFATHGLIDSRYPGLSGVALSKFDAAGAPREFLLRLDDIYGLRLNADLVVLSACDTALGREIRGEGLIGLTQGFLYAGARSLVVSLWQVPDRATAELMTRFYRFMFRDGLGPASALREAQLDIAAERRWRDPYFWAGMLLVGDW